MCAPSANTVFAAATTSTLTEPATPFGTESDSGVTRNCVPTILYSNVVKGAQMALTPSNIKTNKRPGRADFHVRPDLTFRGQALEIASSGWEIRAAVERRRPAVQTCAFAEANRIE